MAESQGLTGWVWRNKLPIVAVLTVGYAAKLGGLSLPDFTDASAPVETGNFAGSSTDACPAGSQAVTDKFKNVVECKAADGTITKPSSPAASAPPATNLPPAQPGAAWIWPVKANVVTGPCWNSVFDGNHHAGMDMNSTQVDNEAIAVQSGEVLHAGPGGKAGNYVTIKTEDPTPVYVSYEHLKRFKVTLHQHVNQGDPIGIIGKTGHVRLGPDNKGHLHLSTAKSDTMGSARPASQKGSQTFDPMDKLSAAPPPVNSDGTVYRCTR